MILDKNHILFPKHFAKYMQSKEGQALALYIVSQLVDSLEINQIGHVTTVELNADVPIVLDVE